MTKPIRVVTISENGPERKQLMRSLDGLPGVEIVAEVDLICAVGKQAGDINVDCVLLDIDRYPMAGTLGLAQVRATFPDARVILLVRSLHPRFTRFLKESGASCCIDKDHPDMLAQLISACRPLMPVQAHGVVPALAA